MKRIKVRSASPKKKRMLMIIMISTTPMIMKTIVFTKSLRVTTSQRDPQKMKDKLRVHLCRKRKRSKSRSINIEIKGNMEAQVIQKVTLQITNLLC